MKPRLISFQIRSKIGGQQLSDFASWLIALITSEAYRYDFHFDLISWNTLFLTWLTIVLVQFISGKLLHLYRGRFLIATVDELRALILSTLVVVATIGLSLLVVGPTIGVPRSTVFIAAPLFLVLSGSIRLFRRVVLDSKRKATNGTRVLILGAGTLAESVIPQLLRDQTAGLIPVGLIDDDPSKQNRWISGIGMKGNTSQLASIVEETGAQAVVIAVRKPEATLIGRIEEICRDLGIQALVFPSLSDSLRNNVKVDELRAISIEDIIGRRQVDTQVQEIASYLTGKRVLVTGAGGSIGSELCKQIYSFGPSRLALLDRDETGLQSAELLTTGQGLMESGDLFLADIRDKETIENIFQSFQPDVVFHAAALKHLPALEKFPDEAWKTNVLGTLNVLEAAANCNSSTFVNISTDKAAQAINVLGKSKKVAEGLTSWYALQTSQRYLSVRFGNVLGSRGSLIPTLATQIENGGPITITHPEVTRYFMTIPEACQLVLQAGSIGRPSDVLILDMGRPVRIMDIARRMIELSGKNIQIKITGLRNGEKLHEDLYDNDQGEKALFHPLITHSRATAFDPKDLDQSLLS